MESRELQGPQTCRTLPPKIGLKLVALAASTFLELIVRLVPRRIPSLSPGDGLEDHFQTIFAPISEL